jgi:RimJ/RimL family protein N-acetyltransferase
MPDAPMNGIAQVRNGKIVGAAGFTDWMDCSVQIHCAGDGAWLSRSFLRAVFGYAFAEKPVVIGCVGSANTRALRLNRKLGFKVDGRIDGAHADGALVIMSMRRGECRWLN